MPSASIDLTDLTALESWLAALALVLAALVLGYGVRLFVFPRIVRLAARTATDLDDLVLAAVKHHIPLWFVLGGFALAAHVAPIGPQQVDLVAHVAAALLLLSLSFAAAGLVGGLVDRAARRAEGSFATTSLAHNVLKAIVLGIGAMLVLVNLGIEVTPLLTALGVGSLAVALALQPTLSNLFAGLHLSIAKPIRVGDTVELEGGVQGVVADIGWRATNVRDGSNNLVVLPNARLGEMILKNFTLPEPEQALAVDVGVGYGSDLGHVERVTCDVARDVLASTPGGVPTFEPFVRYRAFGDSAILFSVILRVKQFGDRPLVLHEFVKRLKQRYDQEKIEIPFPQRALHATVELRQPPPEPSTARGDPGPA